MARFGSDLWSISHTAVLSNSWKCSVSSEDAANNSSLMFCTQIFVTFIKIHFFFPNLKNQEWHDLQATSFFLCHERTRNNIKVHRLIQTEGVWRRVFVVKLSGPYSLPGIPGKGWWWQSLMAKTSLSMSEVAKWTPREATGTVGCKSSPSFPTCRPRSLGGGGAELICCRLCCIHQPPACPLPVAGQREAAEQPQAGTGCWFAAWSSWTGWDGVGRGQDTLIISAYAWAEQSPSVA